MNSDLIFKGQEHYVTSPFGNRVIGGVKQFHKGTDYGTHLKYIPCYSIVDGKVQYSSFEKTMGYYVYIQFTLNGKPYRTRYLHLKEQSKLKAGQTIKKGDLVGIVGATGQGVTGIHLHIDIYDEKTKTYLDFEKFELGGNMIGTPTTRNEFVNQIEIKADDLRARKTPNGEILGYIKKGIYNIIKSEKAGDYTWYEVEPNIWVAYSDKWATIYDKPKCENCVKLEEEIEKLKNDFEVQRLTLVADKEFAQNELNKCNMLLDKSMKDCEELKATLSKYKPITFYTME